MSEYDTADMKNLHYHAFNYRNAHSTQAGNYFNTLEEFVSKMCIAASDRWREEWSEQCNENQILHNTCDEAIAFVKELTQERDALAAVLDEIAQIDPYNTSSMGFVVVKAQAALLRHNVRVNQCPSCGGFCKKSGCERRDSIEPCKHFRAGMTNKSKEECPYCRIESLEATAPQWHDAPTEPGLWVRNSHEGIGVYSVYSISEAATKILKGGYARWYGPIPEDKP